MNDLFSMENKYRKSNVTDDLVDEFGERQIVVGVLERVSTDMQANEGDSLEMQRELAQEHAKEINGIIYKFYTEEGVSASKTRIEKRHKLQELIQDVRDGKINYIVAYKRDRIFRNAQEYMWFIQFLVDNNCEIYLTAREEQQIDLSAFKVAGAAKMMEVMMAMISEMESATTSTRVSDTMINLAKKGEYTGGSTPIGYHRVEGKFLPIDGVKELFSKIEDLYLQGFGLFSIAKWLNGEEVKGLITLKNPIPKPIENKTSDIWNHRNINTILFNPIYTGHFSYQSKKNLDLNRFISKNELIEPIRTEERQRDLNALHNKKIKNARPARAYITSFLLSGLLYCAECGEKMMTSSTQRKNSDKKHSYYRCKSQGTNYYKTKCENHGYRKEEIEIFVLKVAKEKIGNLIGNFLDLEVHKIVQEKIKLEKKTHVNQADDIKGKIKDFEKKLNRYTELVIELNSSKEDIDIQKIYMKKQRDILKELNDLRLAYTSLDGEDTKNSNDNFAIEDFMNLAKEIGNIIETSSVHIQKQFLENLFTVIYVDKNRQIKMVIREGLT
ncbi:recombinase family protein [Lysinibacillus xylanilyticus]|uniref:recombinase family protein n=1 Tax=Lysinibacillus xylanilyticus TaxID=582475 RepID=UPI00380D9023